MVGGRERRAGLAVLGVVGTRTMDRDRNLEVSLKGEKKWRLSNVQVSLGMGVGLRRKQVSIGKVGSGPSHF